MNSFNRVEKFQSNRREARAEMRSDNNYRKLNKPTRGKQRTQD